MLSISTSWFDQNKQPIGEWLKRVKKIGYNAVELSYKVTQDQLDEAIGVLEKLDMKVSSIHNFCPTPNDGDSVRHISNYYRLSSLEEEERLSAVKWTKIAIDTAVIVSAKVVIIHAGTLDFEDERSPKLFQLFIDGQVETPEFNIERKRILNARNDKKGPYIEALNKSLDEVTTYARVKGIIIGMETRYYPIEIPNFEEIGYFLNQYDKQVMGYWHDVGHAEINGRLGVISHQKFLDTYRERLIGVHLHGVKGRRDHLAPFEGDMNLKQYLPYFMDPVIRVVESKNFADEELIQQAVKKLS